MGLDMYLNAKRQTFLGKENEELGRKVKALVPELNNKIESYGTRYSVRYVEIEVGYWRKANHIHKWFVNQCANGTDDCKPAYVEREQLEELKALCHKVIHNPELAASLLPPQTGFFFGSTEFSEGYFDDLKHTIEVIDQALTLSDDWDFFYRASW